MSKQDRYSRRKMKHRKDHNHGKNGYVAGNPRYDRAKEKRSQFN